MIEIIWEFVVKEEARGQFELVYGPGGDWGRLFAAAPGFRGTTLLRDTRETRRYLVVDIWDSEARWAQALADHEAEYRQLQRQFDEWTEARTELGVFTIRAQATVRSQGRLGRGRAGEGRSRG